MRGSHQGPQAQHLGSWPSTGCGGHFVGHGQNSHWAQLDVPMDQGGAARGTPTHEGPASEGGAMFLW